MYDKDIDMKEIKDICCNHFGVSASDVIELSFDDITPEGTIVFYAEIELNENISEYFLSFYETEDGSMHCISEPLKTSSGRFYD